MIWSLSWQVALAAFALGYMFGSVPFGLVLTRLAGGPDLRSIGSGNIGATNVLRTGNKPLAAATLLLDALKGAAAALIASYWGLGPALVAAFGALIGHVFPVWLNFRGGKGVATFIGCLFGIAWPVGLAFCAIWLAVAFATRYSSLSALVATIAAPFLLWWLGGVVAVPVFGVMAAIVVLKHHENIRRLIAGTESRIGQKG